VSLADKIVDTFVSAVDFSVTAVKEPLIRIISSGLDMILDIIGKGLGNRLNTIVDYMGTKYGLNEDSRKLLKSIWTGDGEWTAILGGAAAGSATGGLISSTIGPYLKLLEHEQLRKAQSARFDPATVMAMFFRDWDSSVKFNGDLLDQGWTPSRIEAMQEISYNVLTPELLAVYRHRFGMTELQYLSLCRKAGWDKETAHKIWELSFYYPSAQDLITWTAKEVFEPDSVEKYGLDNEFERLDLEAFAKAGISTEQVRNYWIAHWQHPSLVEVIEMLRRGQMTEAEVWEWFRLVEIPPFWRQKLINIMWAVPTRVDVRRFWDMRTITEERLREIYTHLGYHGKDLDDYILWTKVYTALPDLLARYKNGWINSETVYQEIVALGVPEDRAREIWETKVKKPAQAERTQKERDLTKSEIVKGVKKGFITANDGIALLQEMGYDKLEAEYIIVINVESQGSPETYLELRKIVELWKGATGMSTTEVPQKLIELEKQYNNLKQQRDAAVTARKSASVISDLNAKLATAEYRYHQLYKSYKL